MASGFTVRDSVFRSRLLAWFIVSVPMMIASSALAQDPPFTGIVTADKVNVRSGAGDTYYPVTTLSTGEKVRVLKNLYGWYEIAPPQGAYSYIDKQDVKLDPGGKRGVIARDRAAVRAPSPSGADVGASFKIQLRLPKGTAVDVSGEQGEFYKVAPPEGAHVYIHSQYVRPATDAELAQSQEAPAPAPSPSPAVAPQTPAPKAEPAPAPVPPAVEAPQPAPKPQPVVEKPEPAKSEPTPHELAVHVRHDGGIVVDDKTYTAEELGEHIDKALVDHPDLRVVVRSDRETKAEAVTAVLDQIEAGGVKDVSIVPLEAVAAERPATERDPAGEPTGSEARTPRLEDVERRYADAKKQTLIEQPLEELIVAYEELLSGESLSPTDRGFVQARLEVLRYRRDLQARMGDVQALRQQLDLAREQREEAERRKPRSYIAVGRLQASTLYTGEKLPLLYRVSDPSTGLTIAYVQPPPDDDYAAAIGQFVGVLGDKEYDPTLKLQVIKAKAVDVLKARE